MQRQAKGAWAALAAAAVAVLLAAVVYPGCGDDCAPERGDDRGGQGGATLARHEVDALLKQTAATLAKPHVLAFSYMNLVTPETANGFCRSLQSALHCGVDLHVLGLGERWQGTLQKMLAVEEAIDEDKVADDAVVVFADGADVLWVGGAETVAARFRARFRPSGARMVFGGTCNCYPYALFDNATCDGFAALRRDNVGPYPWPNTGVWVGEAGFVRRVIRAVEAVEDVRARGPMSSDQARLYRVLQESPELAAHVAIDSAAVIFQTMAPAMYPVRRRGRTRLVEHALGSAERSGCNPGANTIVQLGGRSGPVVINQRTKTRPLVLHFNQKSEAWRSMMQFLPWNQPVAPASEVLPLSLQQLRDASFRFGARSMRVSEVCSGLELASEAAHVRKQQLVDPATRRLADAVASASRAASQPAEARAAALAAFAAVLERGHFSAAEVRQAAEQVGAGEPPCRTAEACWAASHEAALGGIAAAAVEEAGCDVDAVSQWVLAPNVEVVPLVGHEPDVPGANDIGYVAAPIGERYGFAAPRVLNATLDLFFFPLAPSEAWNSAMYHERYVYGAVMSNVVVTGEGATARQGCTLLVPRSAAQRHTLAGVRIRAPPAPEDVAASAARVKMRHFVRAASPLAAGCHRYSAWLFSCLPRLLLMQEAMLGGDDSTIVLLPADAERGGIPDFVAEMLALSDDKLPSWRRVAYDARAEFHITTLLTVDWASTDMRPGVEMEPPRAALQLVRFAFTKRLAQDAPRTAVVYCSTAGNLVQAGDQFRITNEAEVVDRVRAVVAQANARRPRDEQLSFVVHERPPGRDVEADIRLFHSALVVVGAYGDNLANVVFCAPGAAVVELPLAEPAFRRYMHAAAALQLEYYAATWALPRRSFNTTVAVRQTARVAELVAQAVDDAAGQAEGEGDAAGYGDA